MIWEKVSKDINLKHMLHCYHPTLKQDPISTTVQQSSKIFEMERTEKYFMASFLLPSAQKIDLMVGPKPIKLAHDSAE